MTNNELKAAAAARLRKLGMDIADDVNFTVLSDAVGTLGAKRPYNAGREDHVRAWMAPQRPESLSRAFKPMDAKKYRHDRQADIDAGQPPFMTPRGAVGNGSENSPVWRR